MLAQHIARSSHAPLSTFTLELCCSKLTQYKWLLRRYLRSYWRNPPFNSTRLMLAFVAGLAQGSFYWGKGNKYDTSANVQARVNVGLESYALQTLLLILYDFAVVV